MDTERSQRVAELFAAALALEARARRAFLESSTASDAGLRAEVESLLEHHEAAGDFMGQPLIESELADRERQVAPLPAPERIGSYRVVRELGHGGMGVVYLAEQEHPRREVALKVIRPGVASAQALRRFEHEAQVLARLQHPGIAQIFEAGTADYGFGPQPYFALEYVRGPTLAEFVEEKKLGTRARLELLAQVCDALEHAHQRGVIHRDLKPSNILVESSSAAAQVKVLDFGIARVTDSDVQTTSLRTDIGQVIGTVPYMSPEQAGGDPSAIDHKSDVYALGVIGYELLCGRLPLDVVGKPLHEAVRIVREDEPTPLSKVVPLLRGDVETIFAKALEKDRERRYASAGELAADIRRYLSDRPIVARRASRAYVLSKFARRNKVLVGGVIAVFVALLVGLAGTLRQAQVAAAERTRADKEARRAQAVARYQREMLSRVQPDLDGREVKLADVLDAAAQALPGELAGDPAAEGSVRQMLGQSYYSLGLLAQSEQQLSAAWPLLRDALGPDHDDTLDALGWLATAETDLGHLEQAAAHSEQAHAALLARHGREDAATVVAELNLAQIHFELGRDEEALSTARANLELRRKLFGENDARYLNALDVVGQMLSSSGHLAEAEPLLRESYERGRALEGQRHPNSVTRAAMLANALRELGRFDEAEALYRSSLELGRELLGDEHGEVLACENNLAGLLEQRGQLAQAEELYRRVLEVHERTLGLAHADTRVVIDNLAGCYDKQGRAEDARALRERAAAAQRQ